MDQINHGLHEECGVFGIYDHSGETDMASAVYYALYALQHRGQESCGIAINVDGVITGHRDLGLVNEVFTPQVMDGLPKGGKMAVGHVRYATSGQRVRAPQSLWCNDVPVLRRELERILGENHVKEQRAK